LNAQTPVKALRALLLSLEDTLLITGYALFIAVRVRICAISLYHFKLLCWLFANFLTTYSSIYWSSTSAVWYSVDALQKRWASSPSASPMPAKWR
jgi:hypothetical protein